jgi:hypothetical protein
MDDATYKRVETSAELEQAKKETSYKRGYECGDYSSTWFEKPPPISPSQILKFHLDVDEYTRGFKEGFENGRKRLSERTKGQIN